MSEDIKTDVVLNDEAVQESAGVESSPAEQPEVSIDDSADLDADVEEIQSQLRGSEDDSKEEATVPLHKEKRWQEKLAELEEKEAKIQAYEAELAKARQESAAWQSFNEYAERNPEAAIQYIEYMESEGRVAKGTADRAREQLSLSKGEKPPKEGAPIQDNNVEAAIRQVLQSDPYYQALVAQLRKQEEETEQVFQDFEKKYPDVPKAADDDPLVRRKIMIEAQSHLKEGKPLNEALEEAYLWVMKRDDVIKQVKETGEVTGLISGIQQGITSGSEEGGVQRSKSVSLTADQREIARAAGMTDEEYAKYLEDPYGAMSSEMN